jgi:hypothetical protein
MPRILLPRSKLHLGPARGCLGGIIVDSNSDHLLRHEALDNKSSSGSAAAWTLAEASVEEWLLSQSRGAFLNLLPRPNAELGGQAIVAIGFSGRFLQEQTDCLFCGHDASPNANEPGTPDLASSPFSQRSRRLQSEDCF